MAGQSALGRWKRFLTSFDHIDAAIEAADPSVSRLEFRRLRAQIVEMLCAAQDDDHRKKAEGICSILDRVMAESLATLQSVPADVVPKVLAASADLADAVGALRGHGSERVRGLARDIIRGWKASVEDDIVRMTAAMAKLDALSQLPPTESGAPYVSGNGRGDNAPSNPMKKKEKEEDKPYPKKAVPVVADVARVRTEAASCPRKTTPAAGISRVAMADKQAPVKMPAESMPKKEPRIQLQGNHDIVRMTAAMAKLDALSQPPPSDNRAPYVSGNGRGDNAPSNPMKMMKKQKEEEGKPCPKKAVPLVVDAARVSWTAGASGPKKTAPAAGISRRATTTADKQAPVKMPAESMPKKEPRIQLQGNRPHTNNKMAPAVAGSAAGRVKASEVLPPLPERPTPVSVRHVVRRTEDTVAPTKARSPEEEKMEATKRKLHEGYQEAADAKRRRKIQVIDAPKMLEQKQRKMHPIMRERSRLRNSTAVSRSLVSSFH